jgi:transposase
MKVHPAGRTWRAWREQVYPRDYHTDNVPALCPHCKSGAKNLGREGARQLNHYAAADCIHTGIPHTISNWLQHA